MSREDFNPLQNHKLHQNCLIRVDEKLMRDKLMGTLLIGCPWMQMHGWYIDHDSKILNIYIFDKLRSLLGINKYVRVAIDRRDISNPLESQSHMLQLLYVTMNTINNVVGFHLNDSHGGFFLLARVLTLKDHVHNEVEFTAILGMQLGTL